MDLEMTAPGVANDPYAAPRAALIAGTPRPGAALDALLLGFLVTFVGTSIGSCALQLATLLELVQVRFDHLQLALAMRISIQLVTVASALAGGYCCARVARCRELVLGALLGAITLAIGVLSNVDDDGALGDAVFLAAAFAATCLGAWMGLLHNGHSAVPAWPRPVAPRARSARGSCCAPSAAVAVAVTDRSNASQPSVTIGR